MFLNIKSIAYCIFSCLYSMTQDKINKLLSCDSQGQARYDSMCEAGISSQMAPDKNKKLE